MARLRKVGQNNEKKGAEESAAANTKEKKNEPKQSHVILKLFK